MADVRQGSGRPALGVAAAMLCAVYAVDESVGTGSRKDVMGPNGRGKVLRCERERAGGDRRGWGCSWTKRARGLERLVELRGRETR